MYISKLLWFSGWSSEEAQHETQKKVAPVLQQPGAAYFAQSWEARRGRDLLQGFLLAQASAAPAQESGVVRGGGGAREDGDRERGHWAGPRGDGDSGGSGEGRCSDGLVTNSGGFDDDAY